MRQVPHVVGAAHDHDLRDGLQDARVLLDRHCNVGQRSDRAQHDVAVGLQVCLDQPVDGMLRPQRGTVGDGRQVEQISMDNRRHTQRCLRPNHRPGHAPKHRNLWHADPVEHAQSVLCRVLDPGVAVDARRTQQLDVGRQRGHHEGDGVVGARIDIEDHFCRHRHSLAWRLHIPVTQGALVTLRATSRRWDAVLFIQGGRQSGRVFESRTCGSDRIRPVLLIA